MALLYAAYGALMLAGVTLCRPANGDTAFWPANGVIVAALLVLPLRTSAPFAAICLGVNLVVNAVGGLDLAANLSYSPLNILLSVTAALLIRRFCGATTDLSRAKRLAAFIVICLAAASAEAVLGAIYSILFGTTSGGGLPVMAQNWLNWVLTDGLGLIIATPAVLLTLRRNWVAYAAKAGMTERLALLAITLAVTGAGFTQTAAPLHLAVYPLIVLAAFRSGPHWVAVTVLAVSLVVTPLTLQGHGPIAALPQVPGLLPNFALHIFLASVALCALPATNVLGELRRAAAQLARRDATTRAAKVRAEHAAEAKARFLAVMSHEIRTPLNGIVGFSQALSARPDLPADARRQLDLVVRSSDILLGLVNDILDFSKIEAQRFELSLTPSSLPALVDEVTAILRPVADAKGLALVCETDGFPATAHLADDRRLRQVLLNLANNAIKFTGTGKVRISLTATAAAGEATDRIRVSVTDTGIGVAPDSQDGLFKPFSQLDPSITRAYGGTGLGLAICKSLIEMMDGTIGMTPRAVGSEFWFEVALRRAELAPSATALTADASVAAGRRVLVVDDHAVNREVASLILASAGCEVETCADGAEAVEAVRNGTYDLVLMDVRMPGMDGLAAACAIRALPGPASKTPIVALTADVMADDVAKALAAGMNAHVGKPIDAARLIQVIAETLAARDAALDESAAA